MRSCISDALVELTLDAFVLEADACECKERCYESEQQLQEVAEHHGDERVCL